MCKMSAFNVILRKLIKRMREKITVTLLLSIFIALSVTVKSQRIYYSEPDRDDLNQLKFEILGKYNSNFLVYKNIRNRHFISVYDAEMKLKDKVTLDFIPERVINVELFSNPEHAILIYQYQKKAVVYCMGVTIDGNGKNIGEPLQLDTTQIGFFGDNKIYSTIMSDDKQKLMIFKMKNKNQDEFQIQTLLVSRNLIPLRKTGFNYQLENTKESIADFYLDNEGNFLFSHVTRPTQKEYIQKAKLVVLQANADTLLKYDLKLDKVYLEELRIKVDNLHSRYVLTSLYSKTKRGNIEGLYTAFIDKDLLGNPIEKSVEFTDDFRTLAKGDNSTKLAFNDYYLKHIIVKKDGGVLITGESTYGSSRGSNLNRWDNPWLWGNPWGPGSYYGWSPWNNWGYGSFGRYGWGSPWGPSWNSNQQTRFYADNIMVITLDKDGNMQWNNVIAKSQYDDNTDNLLSYQIMNSGTELLFLYNEWNRRDPMLNAQSLDPKGTVNKQPPLKSLDKGFEFMIRFGKQVSAREMIVPCIYRNAFSFARMEF